MGFKARSIFRRKFFSQVLIHELVFDDFQLLENVVVGEQQLFKLRLLLARQLPEEVFTNRLLFCCV